MLEEPPAKSSEEKRKRSDKVSHSVSHRNSENGLLEHIDNEIKKIDLDINRELTKIDCDINHELRALNKSLKMSYGLPHITPGPDFGKEPEHKRFIIDILKRAGVIKDGIDEELAEMEIDFQNSLPSFGSSTKPGRSYVYRVHLCAMHNDCIIKLTEGENFEESYLNLFKESGFKVPRCYGSGQVNVEGKNYKGTLTEYVRGDSLAKTLEFWGFRFTGKKLLFEAARDLAKMHDVAERAYSEGKIKTSCGTLSDVEDYSDYFRTGFIDKIERESSQYTIADLQNAFKDSIASVLSTARSSIYLDANPENWIEDICELYKIDFESTRIAPAQFDLALMLNRTCADLDYHQQHAVVDQYFETRQNISAGSYGDPANFHKGYDFARILRTFTLAGFMEDQKAKAKTYGCDQEYITKLERAQELYIKRSRNSVKQTLVSGYLNEYEAGKLEKFGEILETFEFASEAKSYAGSYAKVLTPARLAA
jgi:hypothetical protein